MASRFLFFVFLATIILSGCAKKCQIQCGVAAMPVALGYTFNELDSVKINSYTADGLFDSKLSSVVVPLYDSNYFGNYRYWFNPNADSATSDTLFLSQGNLSVISPYNDIEIIVPSNNNKVYRFSKITLGGDATEEVGCTAHGPQNNNCSHYQFIRSYVLNGVTVVVNTPPTYGYLYFQK